MYAQWHRNTFAKDPWNKPLPKDRTDQEVNWRKYRDLSGGLTAELGSHQIDIADWMFGSVPEFIAGVGGLNFIKDGRDIYRQHPVDLPVSQGPEADLQFHHHQPAPGPVWRHPQ